MAAASALDLDSSAFASAAFAVVKFHVHIEIGTFEGILISLVRSFSLHKEFWVQLIPRHLQLVFFSIKDLFFMRNFYWMY